MGLEKYLVLGLSMGLFVECLGVPSPRSGLNSARDALNRGRIPLLTNDFGTIFQNARR